MFSDRDVKAILYRYHLGRGRAANARHICHEIIGHKASEQDTRNLRAAVEILRKDGHPICAHPSHGYFYAETQEEVNETMAFLRSRARTSLKQVMHLRRSALPALAGQLSLLPSVRVD